MLPIHGDNRLDRTLNKATTPYALSQLLLDPVLDHRFAQDAILRQPVDVIQKEMGVAFLAEEQNCILFVVNFVKHITISLNPPTTTGNEHC